jgi:hypothetical protein
MGALQQGHLGRVQARATIRRRRTVMIELGMCRSGRMGDRARPAFPSAAPRHWSHNTNFRATHPAQRAIRLGLTRPHAGATPSRARTEGMVALFSGAGRCVSRGCDHRASRAYDGRGSAGFRRAGGTWRGLAGAALGHTICWDRRTSERPRILVALRAPALHDDPEPSQSRDRRDIAGVRSATGSVAAPALHPRARWRTQMGSALDHHGPDRPGRRGRGPGHRGAGPFWSW